MPKKSVVISLAKWRESTFLALLMATLAMPIILSAAELPPEVPLWHERPPYEVRSNEKEQLRSCDARPESLRTAASGLSASPRRIPGAAHPGPFPRWHRPLPR